MSRCGYNHENGLVVHADRLKRLWQFLGIEPSAGGILFGQEDADRFGLPYWEGYRRLKSGVIKLTGGCALLRALTVQFR